LTGFDPAMLAGLDEPVRRYFAHAIRVGAPLRSAAGRAVLARGDTRRRYVVPRNGRVASGGFLAPATTAD